MSSVLGLSKDYILEDDCVLLRPLEIKDCNNLLLFSVNEPELWECSLVKVRRREPHKLYRCCTARAAGREYPFIVLDKRTQEFAGRSSTLKSKGKQRDRIVLSILKEEWENGVKDRLFAKL